mgnify:CR=1 FL=1
MKRRNCIKKIKEDIPEVEYFIEMKSENKLEDKEVGLQYLIDLGKSIIKSGDNSFEKIEIDPEEFKILFFTSGTTSNAKGVMLNNRNLAENINAVTAYVKLYPIDMLFSVLPLHHCYESTIGFLLPMATGASIAVCEGLRYIVPNLQEAHPTAILTVPLLVESLYKKINEKIVKSKKDKMVNTMISVTNALKGAGIDIKKKVFKEIYDNLGGRLRIIVSAAAPIDKKVGNWLEDIGITFLQGYGLTETSPVVAVGTKKAYKVGSIGKTVPSVEAKLVDVDENGMGELIVKGPSIMIGYYEDEEATKNAIKDGWFYTGDLAKIDSEGYIFICGRRKSVIVLKNGKNIFPEEIEGLINQIDGVIESFIFGKQMSEDKNDIKIYSKIVYDKATMKEKYQAEGEKEINSILNDKIKAINNKMPKYKAIRGIIVSQEPLIKTTTNKIKRHENLKLIMEEK